MKAEKPHIRTVGSKSSLFESLLATLPGGYEPTRWQCKRTSEFAPVGYGATPEEAYTAWRRNAVPTTLA